jgi:hypothetical protein
MIIVVFVRGLLIQYYSQVKVSSTPYFVVSPETPVLLAGKVFGTSGPVCCHSMVSVAVFEG